MKKQEFHLEIVVAGLKISQLLAEDTGLSVQQIKKCMQHGAVWLEHGGKIKRVRRATQRAEVGDKIHFYYAQALIDQCIPKAVLVEDCQQYSIWFKPSGMLSQGSKWGDANTVYRFAGKQLSPERPTFIVHRLDKAASGLMILAHSKKMAARLSQLFETREITKEYQAIVQGDCSKWQQLHVIEEAIDGLPARSLVRCVEVLDDQQRSLVSVQIETGRKHQIRKHLSSCGYPIVGDRLYGGAQWGDVNLQLRANCLQFLCPVSGKRKIFELPEQLQLSL